MKKNEKGLYTTTITYLGKRYYIRAKTEKELWKRAADKQRALEAGQIVTNGNTTVGRWMIDYLDTYKADSIGPKAYKQYLGYVSNYVIPAIGKFRMQDVRQIDLQRLLNDFRGESVSQVMKMRNLLSMAFRQAQRNHIIADNPADGLELPSATEGTHRPLTDFEREHILDLCETHRAGLWVLTMLYCGLRPGETRTLKWADLDLTKRRLSVRTAAEADTDAEKEPKTSAGIRTIPIPIPLCEKLTARLRAVKGMPDDRSVYVFTQPTTNRRHTKTSCRQMWLTFKRQLDLHMGARTWRGGVIPETSKVAEDLSPYCLRHTYCTDLERAGVPINIAKRLMGHSSIKTTARIYTHGTEDATQIAADCIDNFIGNQDKIIPLPAREA